MHEVRNIQHALKFDSVFVSFLAIDIDSIESVFQCRCSHQTLTSQRELLGKPWQIFQRRFATSSFLTKISLQCTIFKNILMNKFYKFMYKIDQNLIKFLLIFNCIVTTRWWMTCTTRWEAPWRTGTKFSAKFSALTPSPSKWQSWLKKSPITGQKAILLHPAVMRSHAHIQR